LADLVEISNVGENGVASEATLSALVRQMEDFARRSGMDPKSAAGRTQKMYNDAQTKGVKVIKEETTSRTAQVAATKEATSALNDLSSRMSSMATGIIGSLVGGFVNLGAEVLNGSNRISDFAQHFPIVGNLLGSFFGMLDQNLDVLRQISGVGAAFDNSIRSLRQAANDTLMMPDEFARVIANNTDAIMFMGTTMTDGARRFARVSRDLQESGGFDQLMQLGFTVEEINDGLLSYTRRQAMMGRLNEMSDAQLRAGTQEYLEDLDAIAKLTGLQRDELEAAQARESLNAQVRFFQNEIEAAGGNVTEFNAGLAAVDQLLGPTWATGFRDALDGVMQQSEEGQALLSQVGPDIFRVAQEFRRTQNVETLLTSLQRLGQQVDETGMGFGDVLLGSLQGDMIGNVYNEAIRAAALNIGSLDEIREEQGARGEVTTQLIEFEENMRRVQQAINDVFLSQQLALLPDLLGRLNNYIDIDNPDGLVGGLSSAMASVTSWFDEFMAESEETSIADAIINRATSAFNTMLEIWNTNETVLQIRQTIREFFENLGLTGPDGVLTSVWNSITEFFENLSSGEGIFNGIFDNIFQGEAMSNFLNDLETRFENLVESIFDGSAMSNFLDNLETRFRSMADAFADAFLNGEAMSTFLGNLSSTLEATGLRLLQNLPFGLFNEDMATRLAELEGQGFARGTQGFMNFGSGTLAALHGREAVIPYNSPAGQLLRDSGYGQNGNSVDTRANTNYNNSQGQTRMIALLESAVAELRESNRQHEQEIRTLRSMGRDVVIGSPY
jgi:hypothetical protein